MRRRLLVGSLLLTAAVTIAFFVPAALALADAEREAQVVELQQEAADVAATVDGAALQRPTISDDDPLGAAKRRGEEEHEFGLYDRAGARVAGDGPAELDAWLRPALDGRSRSGREGGLRVVAVPLTGGGALRATEPADEADERVREALLRLAGQGALLLLLALLGTWLLARRLIRPLHELGAAATRLGGGDFTATAPNAGMRELDEVAAALNATATRLGSAVERIRRLSTDTAHQLRTPLAGLRVSLEAELLQPRPDPRTALEEALGAVERLERTVEDLTELAHDEVRPEPVSSAEVLRAAAERWADQLADAGRSLVVDPGLDVLAMARRPAIDAVLDVLLDNALRHGSGTVTIGTDRGVSGVALRVADEGSFDGTEADLFERRPEPHARSGIGLRLARTLVESEGGRLRLVSSEPTTFQLLLPISRAARSDDDR